MGYNQSIFWTIFNGILNCKFNDIFPKISRIKVKQAFLHSCGDILLELPFFRTIIKVVQVQVTRWLAYIPIKASVPVHV